MHLTRLLFASLFASILGGCERAPAPGSVARADASAVFIDGTQASGVAFRHQNGRNGELHYPEIIGPGVALLDFDNDGRLDLLVLQGTPLGPEATAGASDAPCAARLYRN